MGETFWLVCLILSGVLGFPCLFIAAIGEEEEGNTFTVLTLFCVVAGCLSVAGMVNGW